jgi:hypothetical protein
MPPSGTQQTSGGLRNIENVETQTQLRMADAATWLEAAEPACGFKPGKFVGTLVENQRELLADKIVNGPVTMALQRLVEYEPFEGTVGELQERLLENSIIAWRFQPQTPSHLSNTLRRLRPALLIVDIKVEFGGRTNRGRLVHVSKPSGEYEPGDPRLPFP